MCRMYDSVVPLQAVRHAPHIYRIMCGRHTVSWLLGDLSLLVFA